MIRLRGHEASLPTFRGIFVLVVMEKQFSGECSFGNEKYVNEYADVSFSFI